ncbi:glycosyltransferase, partial [Psychrobacter sp. Ps6]
MKKVTACIVTYNREHDLLRCIEKVLEQSKKLDNIIIYDNASSDDTIKSLSLKYNHQFKKSNELNLLANVDGTDVWVFSALINSGGAGGFHESVKLANEKLDTDYYWLMDDDGYPDKNCLNSLYEFINNSHLNYVMPVSIDIDNHKQLSWATRMKNGQKTICYQKLSESWGKVMDYITPFNGSLISQKCVDDVGYVNKDFFIWGDEYEHYWRCKEAGIFPVTLMNSVFYHPAMKLPLYSTFFNLFKVPYSESELRMVCLARNYTYIYKKHDNVLKIPAKLLIYSWFF